MVLAQWEAVEDDISRRDNNSEKLLDSNMLGNSNPKDFLSRVAVACVKLARALTHLRTFLRRLRSLHFYARSSL